MRLGPRKWQAGQQGQPPGVDDPWMSTEGRGAFEFGSVISLNFNSDLVLSFKSRI